MIFNSIGFIQFSLSNFQNISNIHFQEKILY